MIVASKWLQLNTSCRTSVYPCVLVVLDAVSCMVLLRIGKEEECLSHGHWAFRSPGASKTLVCVWIGAIYKMRGAVRRCG